MFPAHWSPWTQRLAAGIAGALLALAFAPYALWPLAILCPAVLMLLWQGAAPRAAAMLGFCFGVGTFAVGTWWLYISIHVFGQAPVWLAIALLLALVAIMGAYHALLGYLVARWLPPRGAVRALLGVPALWLLIEWLRGWLLSGFPWLTLGYTQTDTWLAGLAPVIGVYGLSACLLLGSGALLQLWLGSARARLLAAIVLLAPWLAGLAWLRSEWTVAGSPVSVAIVQGAIPQDEKWLLANRDSTRERYRELNDRVLGARLILWPESAVPELANDMTRFLADIYTRSTVQGSDVVMGVMRLADNGRDYYNSVLALTAPLAFYDKRHLVPFGEYFPVPASIRTWLRLMSLPYSDFTAGAAKQPVLAAGGLRLAPSICYEDAFGTAQLAMLGDADVLANVTNDAWFGRSSARYQHFQIARMRAIEARRYLIRAANDGISAIVGPHGEVRQMAPQFQPAVLRGTVEPRRGQTPYARVGNWPVLLLAFAAVALATGAARRHKLEH
jgi:apolipoprotein N-acyltransferase